MIVSAPPLTAYLSLLTLFLLACHSSPEDQLRKLQQQLASWEATARLTDELARRGALPETYVRQVDKAVKEGKAQARQQAAKLSQ